MSTSSDRAIVDEYVEALLAPVEALHVEPQEPVMPTRSAAFAPPPTPAPAAPPREAAPAAARTHEPAVAAMTRVANAIAEATAAPEAPSSATKPARWLRVSVEGDRYAVELLRVQEVVRMVPIVAMRGAAPAVLGVMNLRGRIVPVYDLGLWLGAGDVTPGERARIVVVERDDELLGVLVTSVDDVVTLGDDGIEPPYEPHQKRRAADRAIRGVARPGGLPTVLLDANALFE